MRCLHTLYPSSSTGITSAQSPTMSRTLLSYNISAPVQALVLALALAQTSASTSVLDLVLVPAPRRISILPLDLVLVLVNTAKTTPVPSDTRGPVTDTDDGTSETQELIPLPQGILDQPDSTQQMRQATGRPDIQTLHVRNR